jgi:hypothetical protein
LSRRGRGPGERGALLAPCPAAPLVARGTRGTLAALVARAALVALVALTLGACAPAPEPPAWEDGVCDPPSVSISLPDDIRESSGVAASRQYPGVFWTHNDSGWDAVLFAVDSTGAILGRVRVAGATNRDWEDIELAPCTPGSERTCLFIGDIGDNNERHPRIGIYRIPEPNPFADTVSQRATIFRATYPDGPRDAEALFVTDRGIHVINKGRSHPIELFRIPPPYRAGATVQLQRLQQLGPPVASFSAHVTAAAASPDQQRVVVRTYGGAQFYHVAGDTLVAHGRPATLLAPDQRQGEGADFIDDHRLVLTSESTPDQPQSLAIVHCDPDRPEPEPDDLPGP